MALGMSNESNLELVIRPVCVVSITRDEEQFLVFAYEEEEGDN